MTQAAGGRASCGTPSVAPLLASRGAVTAVVDEVMISSSRLAAAVRRSEAGR